MTFPTCAASQGSQGSGSGSPSLSISASSGELVVVFGCNYVSTGTSRNLNISGGSATWNALTGTSVSGQFVYAMWYATNHTGGTTTFSWSAGTGQGCMLSWRFTGYDTSNPIELGGGAGGTGTAINWGGGITPASPGGSKDYYWGAICGNPRGASSEPFSSNYTLNNTFAYGSGTFSSTSVSATAQGAKATASSRNPNNVTWSGTNLAGWATINFVIYPGGTLAIPNRSIIIP